MKVLRIAALVAATTTFATAPVQAASLPPGAVVFTNGVTLGNTIEDPVERPEFIGTVQNDNLISFSEAPGPSAVQTVGGNVQNRVVENSDGNLIFMPRIRDTFNLFGGTLAVIGMQLTGYAGVDVDVDFRLDGLGDKGFSSVSRSGDGDTMTFRYDDPILVDAINPPGRQETSYFSSIVTDATEYEATGTMRIFAEIIPLGGSDTSSEESSVFFIDVANIVVPRGDTTADVPLPASSLLLLGGLAALTRMRRKA